MRFQYESFPTSLSLKDEEKKVKCSENKKGMNRMKKKHTIKRRNRQFEILKIIYKSNPGIL